MNSPQSISPSGRRNEDLLGQMIPPVHLQYLLVVPRECPRRLRLPKYTCTGADEVIVEEPLVETAIEALSIDRVQRVPASINAHEAVAALHLLRFVEELLQGVPWFSL